MNTKTQEFKFKKDCKHSVVFEPVSNTPQDPAIASAVYINKAVLPAGMARTITLTLTVKG